MTSSPEAPASAEVTTWPDQGHILTLTCADRVGIVAGVTGFLAARDGFILDSQQYADLATGRFFMRVAFKAGGPRFPGFGPNSPTRRGASISNGGFTLRDRGRGS